MKLKVENTGIEDLFVIETDVLKDNRGIFSRLFCTNELSEILGKREIKQINISKTSQKGSIRGMHYQRPPKSEMKLIRCLQGEVWDVAIDLRPKSRTYLKYFATNLSDKNMKMLAIPEGFAHGFQTIKENTELLYLHTQFYSPEHESGIKFDDPTINVDWPMSPVNLSKRDMNHTYINESFKGIDDGL